MTQLIRGTLAVICGYIVLVLLATLVQEFWLGGVSYRNSSNTNLVLAGVFTPLSAVVAGYVTASIARRWWIAHALPVCLAIAVVTTFLYRTRRVDGPWWFEALAGASLIGGVLLGMWIWRRIASGAA
jgi:FtsH-binding integral membrane protein